MRTALRLAWRMSRGAGRRDAVRAAGMILGVAFTTFALLLGATIPRVLSAARATEINRYATTTDASQGPSVSYIDAQVNGVPWTQVVVGAPTGMTPLPPGLKKWPLPGHSVVSPALAAALATQGAGASSLGEVDGNQVLPEGLSSPDDLISYTVTDTVEPGRHLVGFGNSQAPTLTAAPGSLLIGELALLVGLPAIAFITVCLQLSLASRGQRFRALSVLGLSPRVAERVFAIEMTGMASSGALVGALMFGASQDWLGTVGVAGLRWWPGQANLAPWSVLVCALGAGIALWNWSTRTMRRYLSAQRNTATRGGRLLNRISIVVFAAAFTYSAVVATRAMSMPKGAGFSDHILGWLLAALALGIISLAVIAPSIVSRCCQATVSSIPSSAWRLGMRQAIFNQAVTRRLLGSLLVLIAFSGFSSAVLQLLHYNAAGDLSHVEVQIPAAAISVAEREALAQLSEPRIIVLVPKDMQNHPVLTVANCADIAAVSPSMFTQPDKCVDSPQATATGWKSISYTDSADIGYQVPIPTAQLVKASFDLKLPRASAPWAITSSQALFEFSADARNSSLPHLLDDLRRAAPSFSPQYGVSNPDAMAIYSQQVAVLRIGTITGTLLVLGAMLVSMVENRWDTARSVRAQQAMGVSQRTLRLSFAVQIMVPLLICGPLAIILTSACGYAVLSVVAPDATRTSSLAVVPTLLWVSGLLVSWLIGIVAGAPRFVRAQLADQ